MKAVVSETKIKIRYNHSPSASRTGVEISSGGGGAPIFGSGRVDIPLFATGIEEPCEEEPGKEEEKNEVGPEIQ